MAWRNGTASEQAAQTVSGTTVPEDEPVAGTPPNPASERVTSLFEQVLEKENLRQALRQVRRNRGAPGIDGMRVDELSGYLKDHWLRIKDELQHGRYRPQPVKRVEIPKPDGRKRKLGIPTVLDRFIQQALNQVLQRVFDPTFHPHSYGFRPGRSAHQAVRHTQAQVKAGWGWVVDLVRYPRCWPTWCWTNWTKNWPGAATASPATPTTVTSS